MMRVVIAFLWVAFAGCGGSISHVVPSDLSAEVDMSGDANTAFVGPTHEVNGQVLAAPNLTDGGTSDGSVAPLIGIANAMVCLLHYSELPCATTDANGNYTIKIPIASATDKSVELSATVLADGYLGETDNVAEPYVAGTTSTDWSTPDQLWTNERAESWAASGGFTYPPNGTAYIQAHVFQYQVGPLAGATVTVSPSSGHVVYADASGALDPALTATSASGLLAIGNVTPGKFTLTVNAPGKTCSRQEPTAWPATAPNTVDGEIAANTISGFVAALCQ